MFNLLAKTTLVVGLLSHASSASGANKKSRKPYVAPQYSFLPREGTISIEQGFSLGKAKSLAGSLLGIESKLSYYSESYFGFFIWSDAPLNEATLSTATANVPAKLLLSEAGIFMSFAQSQNTSVLIELGAGSSLVFTSGHFTSLAPMLQAGSGFFVESSFLRYYALVRQSYCFGSVEGQTMNFSRTSLSVGIGFKI